MNTWTAAQRRSHENTWASQNVPTATLEQFAVDALADAIATGKTAGVTCNDCIPVPTFPGQPCTRKVTKGKLKASDATGTNGRLAVSGSVASGDLKLNVTVTLTATLTIYVECDKEGCRCTGCGSIHPNPDQ